MEVRVIIDGKVAFARSRFSIKTVEFLGLPAINGGALHPPRSSFPLLDCRRSMSSPCRRTTLLDSTPIASGFILDECRVLKATSHKWRFPCIYQMKVYPPVMSILQAIPAINGGDRKLTQSRFPLEGCWATLAPCRNRCSCSRDCTIPRLFPAIGGGSP